MLSMMPALWNREFLIDFVEDDCTLSTIELQGPGKFSRQDQWHSVAPFPGIMDMCHLCFTADTTEVRLATVLAAEDRDYIAQFIPEGMWIG